MDSKQNQMPDLSTRIKALAEMEGPCSGAFLYDAMGARVHDWDCELCGGTGRVVPFKELRSRWEDDDDHSGCSGTGECEVWGAQTNCEGRGWVPEPDLEKACWRIHVNHPYVCYASTCEEEISAAEAWAKEQDGTP